MNQVQIAIIALVAVIVLGIVVYYIYQENKFKKIIENNFNQRADDVIHEERGLVFENQQEDLPNSFQASKKDKPLMVQELEINEDDLKFDPLLDDVRINDKSEQNSSFNHFDQVQFSYANNINPELDHVIDIVFDKPVKVKAIPEISQYSSKNHVYFLLEKGGNWSIYERGKKYTIEGIKLLINLVDPEGVISELQINNIYNELAKFTLHHDGHIRQTDSELKIRRIQQQLKSLSNIELELGLYMVNKDELSFRNLAKYFESNGFNNNNGVFEYYTNAKIVFSVCDEHGKPFDPKGVYRLFSINSKLHHLENPILAIEKIFDFAEHYMQYFESRLLTTNKLVLSERDYHALEKQVNAYIATAKRQGATLGSSLIKRVLP